jgi:hypothetical protein
MHVGQTTQSAWVGRLQFGQRCGSAMGGTALTEARGA